MIFRKKILFFLVLKVSWATIDLNMAELQHLADHLTTEECRRFVAAIHFNSFEQPNALDQAERKVPKDIPCIKHLLHWNSQEGEGKGQTHELMQHRLRQMGKIELADWLGKTVFHQLGEDMEKGIEEGLDEITTESSSIEVPLITLEPLQPKIEDPTGYSLFDYLLYAFAVVISVTIVGLCSKLCLNKILEAIRKRKSKKYRPYDFIETDTSGSESEDKFDVRIHTSSSHITR